MSRYSIKATMFLSCPQIVRTCSIIYSRAVIVNLFSLAPIYIEDRRLLSSTSFNILVVIIASRTLAKVFSRAIGLYAFSTIQSNFYSFFSTTILDSLKLLGQQLVQRYTIKKQARIGASLALQDFRTLFVILSRPRALSRESFLRILRTLSLVASIGIQISLEYQASTISSSLASTSSRKKYVVRAQALSTLVYQRLPQLSLITRNQGSQASYPTLSLTYLTSFYIFQGQAIISLTIFL